MKALIIITLALLFHVPPAAATPITFYAPPGEVARAGFGSDRSWVIGGNGHLDVIAGLPPGVLEVGAAIVPYTRQLGAYPFTVTWTFDDHTPVVMRQMLPQYDYGPDCQFGCPTLSFGIASLDLGALIDATDWGPHQLVVTLSVPDDTLRYELELQQPAPEPGTLVLFGTTLLLLGWSWRSFHVER